MLQDEIKRIESEGAQSFLTSEPKRIFQEAFVDVTKKIEHPPIAISIGTHSSGTQTFPTSFATYGNFSCIIGASKSRKTFLKSLLTSVFIGGQANAYTSNIISHRERDMYVIDIDTEQSEYHSQKVFQRVCRMVGSNYPFYKPFALRPYTFTQRVQFIEYLIYESEFKDNIGLMCIDGIADLISDINDISKADEIIQKLMKWTHDKKMHIIANLHTNFDSKKARGHLGSFVLQKAETVAHVERGESNMSNVSFPYSRGYPIDDFKFSINQDGIPYTENSMPIQSISDVAPF